MTKAISQVVLSLYIAVLILLPFSRLSELPILFLIIIGTHGLIKYRKQLRSNEQFKILSVMFFSYFFAIMFSAWDSYWQDKTWLVALSSWRFYLASIAVILYLRQSQIVLLFKIIAVVAIVWSADALLQYFIGFNVFGSRSYEGRLSGIFGEYSAKLGPVLVLLLPLTMIALIKHHSVIRWLSLLLMIVIILLSGTRSAWIMMVFVLLAYWLHHVKQRRFQLLAKAMLVGTLMVVGLWLTSADFQQRIQRSMSALDGTQSGLDFALSSRLPIWKTSWQMIEKNPINGVGARAFRKAYPEYALENDSWQQQKKVGMHAHHWLLEILAETGFIGLLLISFAIFKLWLFVRKNYHSHYSWAFSVALISAFLPITSTYSIFASFWSICIWFIGIGLIVVSKSEQERQCSK